VARYEELEDESSMHDDAISMIDASIVSATLNRRLFITARGHLGLGPGSVLIGDHIYRAKGSRASFMLRPSS
jgi:hypothetical protein